MLKRYLAYLRNNPQKYWFKRKLYGWGWVPVSWQGWLVIGVWLALVFLISFSLEKEATDAQVISQFVLPLILLTAGLIFVCYKKGESPRWQWGLKDEEK